LITTGALSALTNITPASWLRPPHPADAVQLSVDILGKWHGTKYRFIQRYRSGFPENLGQEFDAL